MAEEKKEEVVQKKSGWVKNTWVAVFAPIGITLGLRFVFGLGSMSFWAATVMLWIVFGLELVYPGSVWPRRLAKLSSAFLVLVIIQASVGGWLWGVFEARFPTTARMVPAFMFNQDRKLANTIDPGMVIAKAAIEEGVRAEEARKSAEISKLVKAGELDKAAAIVQKQEELRQSLEEKLNSKATKTGEVKPVEVVEVKRGEVKEITLNPGQSSKWMKLVLAHGEKATYSIDPQGNNPCDIIYADGDIVHVGQPEAVIPNKKNPVFSIVNTHKTKQTVRVSSL